MVVRRAGGCPKLCRKEVLPQALGLSPQFVVREAHKPPIPSTMSSCLSENHAACQHSETHGIKTSKPAPTPQQCFLISRTNLTCRSLVQLVASQIHYPNPRLNISHGPSVSRCFPPIDGPFRLTLCISSFSRISFDESSRRRVCISCQISGVVCCYDLPPAKHR